MNGSILALNITPEDVKLLEIKHENDEKTIRRLYHGAPNNEDSKDPINIAEIVKGLTQEDGPKTLHTVLVINSQDLEYRDFSFPFDSKKKAKGAISFEISSEYPSTDYIFDHIRSIAREPGKNFFLAAIADKKTLARRIREAEDAGLQLVGITSDISTLGNYFHEEDEALVMEMGEKQTLFALYTHGLPVLVRGIPTGIKELREGPKGFDREELRPLSGEIKRTIHSFNAKTGLTLSRIYVTGNILVHKEILEYVKEALELDFIEKAPHGTGFNTEERIDDLNTYASVLGAAEWKRNSGRTFNFLKDEFVREDPHAVQRRYLRWGVMILGFFLFTLLLSSWLRIAVLDKRKDFLSTQIRKTFKTTFPRTERIVDEVRQAKNILNAASLQLAQGNSSFGPSILDVLEIISRALPDETDFQIMSFFWERGKLEINGRTNSFQTVNTIKELLSGVQDFSEVNISNAKNRNDGEDVEFKVTIRLAG
jgi:Tfp pilus assembly protein PilN